MQLTTLDWTLIAAYFALALGVGLWASKKAKTDAAGYFLAGRNMPWWLLGVSMVATTFSTDTPNLVTDLVRQQGVAGKLGMVGIFVDWHGDRVCVCSALAPIRCAHGHQFL